jgi:hypothetical protein
LAIEFRLSRDPQLLQQYYELRQRCYRRELGLPDFDGSEDTDDQRGHILLAIENGRCIGGARVSPRVHLPSQVRKLNLDRDTCCMWERFVFDPSVRSVQLIRDFCARLIEVSQNLGYHHALVLSSLRNARFYRQCHTAVGVPFQIERHVPHSAENSFAGLEHYLSIAHLRDRQALRAAA